METCASCGHELADGQFCTSCGAPRQAAPFDENATRRMPEVAAAAEAWRTDTAERPAVSVGSPTAPAAGPSHGEATAEVPVIPGDGPRFPLYADQAPAELDTEYDTGHAAGDDRRRPIAWLPWAAAAAAVLVVALLAGWLLTGGSGGDSSSASDGTHGQAGSAGGAGGPDDLAREATAHVPATAPPNQDLDGNMVRYEAPNLLDGVPTTCWRMAGDGTGQTLTFDLPKAERISTVGLINGYAKTATGPGGTTLDWYHGNRRVLKVEWSFDDGSTVTQNLTDSTRMQTVEVGPVTTRQVQLRLLEVSPPGVGRAARDYTPISDITLLGG
jgi:hypothetical protein